MKNTLFLDMMPNSPVEVDPIFWTASNFRVEE
jgi:hypothetical protein